ncbi:carboxypeptidase N subunit 2-like [Nasonia vitripennis]|uniref:Uncharacterized protein n=1 Tax=Nasonia vitripennis TaxID=7425 RepID=A0A7M7GDR0_NASVI|nr:carboxypeptidase N subunit 2-like [Nasonia vitripennis]
MIGKVVSLGLVLLALTALAEGFCYRKNPPKSQENAEQLLQPGNYSILVCVKSTDFAADLEKAPKQNITEVWFSMSNVPKLQNDAFAKYAEKIVKIEIWSSKLAEIEDGALKGLKELKGLILPRNELTTLKASWFKETPKLLELNLAFNHLRTIEVEFLKLVPALISLDLRGNELASLPGDFAKQLPASLRRINIFNNPLNYKQSMEIVEWSKNKDDKTNESRLKELKHVFNMTKICLDNKTITDKSNDAIDKCVEEQMNVEVDLVAKSTAVTKTTASAAATTVADAAAASSNTTTTTVMP